MMSVGAVMESLKEARKEAQVMFDFCRCVPTKVDSWRGIYAEPAIGWAPFLDGKIPTVAEFLKELEEAISGRVFDGYKGGEYTFNRYDTLHVDNPGQCTNTEIVRVKVEDYRVLLCTEYSE